MWQKQQTRSSFGESLKALEADLQHANSLAAAIPQYYSGVDFIQMRLSYSPLAPFFLFLIEWLDYNCTDTLPSYLGLLHILVYKVYVDGVPTVSSQERKATLREFYSVIYPSLRQLESDCIELEGHNKRSRSSEAVNRKRVEEKQKDVDRDSDRDDECGICMEISSKMVLPSCGHSMCINCFHDWNARSKSCPFCRRSLRRVGSTDLWVLTSNNEIIDTVVLAKENLYSFFLYIASLPIAVPDVTPVFVYNYMI